MNMLNEALSNMKQALVGLHPLDESSWNAFSNLWVPVHFKRKEVITAAGEIEKYLYWVVSGVQRGFHLHNDREATVVFTYSGSFSGILDSFLLQMPSRYYLETLSTSTLLKAGFQQIETCRTQHPAIAELMYRALAQTTKGILERQIELMVYSAEEKFTTLLQRSPHLLQLVPQKYLASYLGIDATTFSKLLGSVKL